MANRICRSGYFLGVVLANGGDPAKRLELSGPGGGAIHTDGKLNLGALSNEELAIFLAMMEKMKAGDDPDA